MNIITRTVAKSLRGALEAFRRFPAVIGHAAVFTVVTMVRIQIDWPRLETWNFLFNSLQWALALGAVFSLAAITAVYRRSAGFRPFLAANLSGMGVSVATFLLLYVVGGRSADPGQFAFISALSSSRVVAAMVVSLLAFIIVSGWNNERSDIARSLFMTQKAFFISLIYGLVIMGGVSGVAGAVQGLLYQGMSGKVYQHIGALSGFLAFTVFVGYFPDFRKDVSDDHWDTAQKQPRFVEVLFGSIMVPIVLALTLVLLLWAGRTVTTGIWPLFRTLASITTSFVVGGIWLHVMVTRHEGSLAAFYRRIYPVAGLVILAFSVWALVAQLGRSGLQETEYSFALLWVFAGVSAVLLLFRKERAHLPMCILIGVLTVFAVLPVVGYHALPVSAQVSRLERLLVSEGILVDGELVAAAAEPDRGARESITDAVNFLARAEEERLPEWFDRDLQRADVFRERLGFEQVWPELEEPIGGYLGTHLVLPSGAVDIQGYEWAIQIQDAFGETEQTVTVDGDRGRYSIRWMVNPPEEVPVLTVSLDGRQVLETRLDAYIDGIIEAFPPAERRRTEATLEDMTLSAQSPEVDVLLVFRYVEIFYDTRQDTRNLFVDLHAVYLRENN